MEKLVFAWIWAVCFLIGVILLECGFEFWYCIPERVAKSLEYAQTPYHAQILTGINWGVGICMSIFCTAIGGSFISLGRLPWLGFVANSSLVGCLLTLATGCMLVMFREGDFFIGLLAFFFLISVTLAGAFIGHMILKAIFDISDNFFT